MRFAYSTINWGTTPDFAAAFAEIREAGWRAVELFWHDLGWMGPPERMRDLLAGAGLTAATSFGLVRVPVDAAQLVRLRNEVAHAAALGATHYGVNGGDRLRWRPPDEAEEVGLARLLEELAEFGEAVGVQVAYHPHVACTVETEAEIERLLARTRRLRLCLDVSHIALVGEEPLAHLTAYRERTGYVHLKDWARGRFVEMHEYVVSDRSGGAFDPVDVVLTERDCSRALKVLGDQVAPWTQLASAGLTRSTCLDVLPKGRLVQARPDVDDRMRRQFTSKVRVPEVGSGQPLCVLPPAERDIGEISDATVEVNHRKSPVRHAEGVGECRDRDDRTWEIEYAIGAFGEVVDIEGVDSVPGEREPEPVVTRKRVGIYGQPRLQESDDVISALHQAGLVHIL